MLVDSHCHLDCLSLEKYGGQLSQAFAFANERGVETFLCVNIDWEHRDAVLAIAEQHEAVYASVGVHPSSTEGHSPSVDELVAAARHSKIVAIGETGLDYYHHPKGEGWQENRFRQHIEAAIEVNKPLIIHTRDAREETIAILREANAEKVGGVMHCFTETWAMAEAAIALGFYISISGIVTFKNALELQAVAKKVPLDRLLIETDAPYLAPVPYRGKPNEPAYVREVAEAIAKLRGETLETIATVTTENFSQLFLQR